MEFITNPTKQQLAVIEHGLDEYNAGVACGRRSVTPAVSSAGGLRRIRRRRGWVGRRGVLGEAPHQALVGTSICRITNPKVSAAA